MAERKRTKDLKKRVEDARLELNSLPIKSPRFYFAKKYPKYAGEDMEERLNNLWYLRAVDEDFTKKLEAFVVFIKTQNS